MSEINQESRDAWLETISKNYSRDMNSPFELNMMEAKIRKNIHAPKKHKASLRPALGLLFSMMLVFGWTMLSKPAPEFSVESTRYVQVDEPHIHLFSTLDLQPTEDNFLPDDYITISQVMFD